MPGAAPAPASHPCRRRASAAAAGRELVRDALFAVPQAIDMAGSADCFYDSATGVLYVEAPVLLG